MISKNQQKLIHSLANKKYRKKHGLFLVQGEKNITELIASDYEIEHLFAEPGFFDSHRDSLRHVYCTEASQQELEKAGTFQSNNTALALVKTRLFDTPKLAKDELVLALDGVGDPGNLGTIIRLADWYGISRLVCSRECADVYNPKVIASTMGSFTRIQVSYTELTDYLEEQLVPIYGAFLAGENIHSCQFPTSAVIVMGSESHGISPGVAAYVSDKITIPCFGGAESLNVAMATGIILDNFKRH